MPLNNLINVIDHWQKKRIVVVGDFMLDQIVYGNVDRLSPDAPVPVFVVNDQHDTPGGAANVCRDLAALQCEVFAVGVLGNDLPADILSNALTDEGIDVSGLLRDPNRPTTIKQNYIGLAQHRHPQKMFRVDHEYCQALDDHFIRELLDMVVNLLKNADVLCLEDYNKGILGDNFCQQIIAAAKAENVPVFVDPAAIKEYSKYRGATCITPNRTEAHLATASFMEDSDEPGKMAQALIDNYDFENVVLTLDKQGALWLDQNGQEKTIPTQAKSVYDVTGAGDMVLAVLASAVPNGADWPQAAQMANVAAGLEVQCMGVVPIALEKILLEILQDNDQEQGKLRALEQLLVELKAHRAAGKKISFTNGCFDILHAGHVDYLRKARQTGDLLVVAVNTDRSIARIKGASRPVNNQDDRLMVLSELASVDYLVLFDDDTPVDLITAIKPDALVKGADYSRKQVVGHEVVEAAGGQVVLVPLVEGRSTTNIIEKVQQAK